MATSGDAGHVNVLSHQIGRIEPTQYSVFNAPCYSTHDLGLSLQGVPSLPPGSAIAPSSGGGDQTRHLQLALPDAPSLPLPVSNLPSVTASSPVPSSEESPSCPVRLVPPDAPSAQPAAATYVPVSTELPASTRPCPSDSPAVPSSVGNVRHFQRPVSTDTPSTQSLACLQAPDHTHMQSTPALFGPFFLDYIPWLRMQPMPTLALTGLRFFSKPFRQSKTKSNAAPAICPIRTHGVQSLLHHSSSGPMLDDEFSAILELQLRPLGVQIADMQAAAYLHRSLKCTISEGDRVRRLPAQHRHMLNLPQGPFLKPAPMRQMHGLSK